MEVLNRVDDMVLMGAIPRRGVCQGRWRGSPQVRYMSGSFNGRTPLLRDLILSSMTE